MEVQVQTPTPSWSSILKEQSQPTNNQSIHRQAATDRVLVGSCHSTKGIAVAVVDASAIIQGGEKLIHSADRFVSVSEVIDEVRDPTSRHFLSFLPFTVDTLEPSSDDLRKVINFARATGDLQTLSDVDLKLIALTYTLEAQIHGTKHLRDSPPPIHTVHVKRLPEKDMPGWGNNVPNLKEWEALEHAVENGANCNSRILPLIDLSENTILIDQEHGAEVSLLEKEGESNSWTQEYADESCRKPRKYSPTKKEVKIEGKKMVVDGIDASQGQFIDDAGDWRPAVSRSTHRRYLRRKARCEMYQTLSETDSQHDTSENIESGNERCPDLLHETSVAPCTEIENPEEIVNENSCEDLSTILNQMRMDEESLKVHQDGEANDVENLNEGMEQLAITSQISESVDTSYMDDSSTEQSWTLRSLSDSSVACVTGDFAMQNVLLQMGLRLVAPGGMQIRELHRWILKCHACFKITNEIGRIFCPSCGNGGTLRKVAVTVGENGIVLAARRPRISLRGTKFSLPLPKGGRNGITKNPILREDQLPQKFLYPKTKKKNKQGEEEIFTRDEIFLHHTDKKAPLQPPIRKALGVFSGKRNPNDNHFSRSMH